MTREEFTQRTGFYPCDEEWNEIYALYIACGMDEETFCGDYKVHSDSDIISRMEYLALENILLNAEESKKELLRQTAYLLIRKADEWCDEEAYFQAVLLIGRSECIRYKFDNNLELDNQDKEYIRGII
jgi:hypothetical protein